MIESVHRTFDPVTGPAFDGIGHFIEHLIQGLTLLGTESPEDEIRQVIVLRRLGTHPDPESGIVLAPQVGLNALEAVVPAGGTCTPESESPDRQGGLIDEDQQILRRIPVG